MQLKLIDVAIVGLLAVAILLPRGSHEVTPLLRLPSADRARVGLLEQRVVREPRDVDAALDLADEYFDLGQSGFALAVLERAGREAKDWRLALATAATRADRLEAPEALEAADRAVAGCAADAACAAPTRARLAIFRRALATVVEQGIDAKKEPARLRAALRAVEPRARIRKPRSLGPPPAPGSPGAGPAQVPAPGTAPPGR